MTRRPAGALAFGLAALLVCGCVSDSRETVRYSVVVHFDGGSAVIDEDGYRELRALLQRTRVAPEDYRIIVRGFAEASGEDALRPALSDERAEAVARYLESEGIARERLLVRGSAAPLPVVPGGATRGPDSGRRVEVTLR